MAEETVLPIPSLALPQNLFVLSAPSLGHLQDKARADLLAGIGADEMGPWYKNILAFNTTLGLADDAALLGELEALKARTCYLTRIADKDKALEAQTLALDEISGLGSCTQSSAFLFLVSHFHSRSEFGCS
ncbi:hypothetical protein FA15DRAFT_707031 [Coprinopsis marcescibilis]|uniref:Uncharacterized protein n=1 Tax=Coprinopsis marcescibilis TaxID=230819 RepID=A0A5C3KMS3_COPMA|nr:hypothetical protein FA15DRAFT_707031 [Coprinopsis marcescibilis]